MALSNEQLREAAEHARRHPEVKVVATTTLVPGSAICFCGVPSVFGPEIHCREEDYSAVKKVVEEVSDE